MDKRTRILAGVAVAAALIFVVDGVAGAIWFDPSADLSKKLQVVDAELEQAHVILARGDQIKKEWEEIRRWLDRPRLPDVPSHFHSHLDGLCGGAGLNPDIQASPPRQRDDFKEYAYEVRAELKWSQLVDLLWELHESREFLKPVRLGIDSRYDKEEKLALSLRVSTIAWAPEPKKKRRK